MAHSVHTQSHRAILTFLGALSQDVKCVEGAKKRGGNIIITGLFQATRPIANTNNTKLHKKHLHTHKHMYTASKRKRKKHTQKGKIRISLHHKTKFS